MKTRIVLIAAFSLIFSGCTKSYFYVDTVQTGDGDPGTASLTITSPTVTTNVTVRNGILMSGPSIPDLYGAKENGQEAEAAEEAEATEEAEAEEETEEIEVVEASEEDE
jgi:hypothetical protein